MLILLDCRPLQYAGAGNERTRFLFSCVRQLSSRRQVEWIFLVDKDWQKTDLLPVPVAGGRLLPVRAMPGRPGWRWWYNWQLPGMAKKHRVDLVMTTGGRGAAPMTIPQCCWMPCGIDPGSQKIDKNLLMAETIFCFSEKDRDRIVSRLAGAAPDGKVRIVTPAADGLEVPLSGTERQGVKDAYADGKEYFYSDITGVKLSTVVDLLKAFSLFKRRQHSNMKFLLAGTAKGFDTELAGRLGSYKFRQDIQWLPGPAGDEWGRMMGGAYAMVGCPGRESIGLAVLDAWRAGVPVINMTTVPLGEAGDALLEVKTGDSGQLAECLKSLYKDEGLRGRLIEKGALQETSFSQERSAGEVWKGISAIKS